MKKLLVAVVALAGVATLRSRRRSKAAADTATWREAVSEPAA